MLSTGFEMSPGRQPLFSFTDELYLLPINGFIHTKKATLHRVKGPSDPKNHFLKNHCSIMQGHGGIK